MTTRAAVTTRDNATRAYPGEAFRHLSDVVLKYVGDGCLTWPYARNSAGYGHIFYNGRDSLVHRISCEEENGPPPSMFHYAAHNCGNGHLGCCSRKHLEWKTARENQADMIAHGNSQQGEKHYAAKLTEDAVRFIRSSTLSSAELGDMFGVERTNIIAVRKMKTWRHVR